MKKIETLMLAFAAASLLLFSIPAVEAAGNPCAANPCAIPNPCSAQNPCATQNPCEPNPCAPKKSW